MAEKLAPDDALLKWYECLQGRQVDLIGDYAGNELFLIEGDSLLLHCFDTDSIDFDAGFQLLHAVHSVEVFLSSMIERKSNFHIAFFDSHSQLCSPSNIKPENAFKYQLTRSVVIRHLTVNLRESHPSIKISHYSSYTDPGFAEYVHSSGLYFVMCHDGAPSTVSVAPLPETMLDASINASHDDHTPSISQSDRRRKLAFRAMIYWFVKRGLNVALVNSCELRDTKVFSMVMEGSRRSKPEHERAGEAISSDRGEAVLSDVVDVTVSLHLIDGALKRSEALCLLFCALKEVLSKELSFVPEAKALIYQLILSKMLPLSQRRLGPQPSSQRITDFLSLFSVSALSVLKSPDWSLQMSEHDGECDLADLIDGRLFCQVLSHLDKVQVSTFDRKMSALAEQIIHALGIDATNSGAQTDRAVAMQAVSGSSNGTMESSMNLLPFSNEVFDKHLESVHVKVGKSASTPHGDTAKTFRDLTHWHNTKPVNPVAKVTLTDWQKGRALRSNQMFLRELQQYAASLTNSVGKALDPEVIFTGQAPLAVAPSSASAGATKAENAARIADRNEKKFTAAWQVQLKDLAALKDLRTRFVRTRTFLDNLPKERREVIGSEVELYMLNTLVMMWADICRDGRQKDLDSTRFAALIFDALNDMQKREDTRPIVQKSLQLTSDSLQLPFKFAKSTAKTDRSLSFEFYLKSVDKSLMVSSSPLEFELEQCGPYFDRNIDASPDSRVRFEPDAWQKKVLDLIDEKKSVFVVAPTSAGKTFISFYAMKQVLRESDEGILVYVAPTKALVNQIAAEIQATLAKKFKYAAGKSVWAIHTRDYRINDPQGCQILVTVPHILQIMLLAPNSAKPGGFATRVKRIIYDEIHSIGNSEDGVVWEQLLLLSPCPIVALSATVGNPDVFRDWLSSTNKAMGYELEKVQHPYRYSDLRKFVYQPPETFTFRPLTTDDNLGLPSLDGTPGLLYMHPVASLINESRGIPDDLQLEPRDCLSLWRCMAKHANTQYPVSASLDPAKHLPAIVRKVDVLRWESELKTLLKEWMADSKSPFRRVIEELSRPLHDPTRQGTNGTNANDNGTAETSSSKVDEGDLLSTTLPLLSTLHARNALPALLFNYDRSMCEKIAQKLMEQLTEHEETWKKTSPIWRKKLAAFEDYKKAAAKKKKPAAKKSKSKGDEDDGPSKAELEREAAEMENDPYAQFDPDGPIEGFTFADTKKLMPSEFAEMRKRLEWRHVNPWLIEALTRGIGVHHAGMNRAYRQAVETLFRKRFLGVVIATGTLALGINMPCKTVVFSGDSVFLTALNYRQAAGRAGRRGYDLLGNVVFQNIRLDKICRLVSSRLPDLNGHFPTTTTLILRLFIMLHESKGSPYAKKAINSLLSQPRLYLGGEAFKDQVLHHLRYSIEYLRRQYLIAEDGRPINFAGTVSHLYFTENSSFAFHCLLKDGYFNRLCSNFVPNGKSEDRILDALMLVMAHLFGRRPCRRADQEFVEQVVKRYSSCVFLPRMPKEAEKSLRDHNAETLQVFSTYVKTFAEQHGSQLGQDNTLPLTRIQVGGAASNENPVPSIETLQPTTVRSAFVALSGHGDSFKSIDELCRTARDGVFLESSAIPHVNLYPDEDQQPMNAYLYDFYKHGDVKTLEKANGIRAGDVWFLLNDFSLVLATVITSFKNYMHLSEDSELSLSDVAGSGDIHEIDEDERIANDKDPFAGPGGGSAQFSLPAGHGKTPALQKASVPIPPPRRKKKIVAESWDVEADAEEEKEREAESSTEEEWDAGGSGDDDGVATPASTKATSVTAASVAPGWEDGSGEGLRKVALAFERLKITFDEKFKKMWA